MVLCQLQRSLGGAPCDADRSTERAATLVLNIPIGNAFPSSALATYGALEGSEELVFVKRCVVDYFGNGVRKRATHL